MQLTPQMLAEAIRILADKNRVIATVEGTSTSSLIQTVKDLRSIFGLSLKEAKDLWDAQAAPPVDPVVEAARRIVENHRFG